MDFSINNIFKFTIYGFIKWSTNVIFKFKTFELNERNIPKKITTYGKSLFAIMSLLIWEMCIKKLLLSFPKWFNSQEKIYEVVLKLETKLHMIKGIKIYAWLYDNAGNWDWVKSCQGLRFFSVLRKGNFIW